MILHGSIYWSGVCTTLHGNEGALLARGDRTGRFCFGYGLKEQVLNIECIPRLMSIT